MSFLEVLWFIIISFVFIAYLMLLFSILSDLIRDRDESGIMKAVWVVLLIVFPVLAALVYLIVRGSGMAERNARDMNTMKQAQDDYIRDVAQGSRSPAEEIARAQSLLDNGTITSTEFDAIKSKALS